MDRQWAEAESAYRQRILGAIPPDGHARLLDVGCDDGLWTEELRRRLGIPAEQVAGLEITPGQATLARSRGFDVRTADLEEVWPIADGSIDVVHANQVIEHVKRLDHFASEIRRVLAAGGLTIVCTENLASWHNVIALVLGYQPFSTTNLSKLGPMGNPFALHLGKPAPAESWQHLHVMTLTALEELFLAHGFEIESMWGTGYHPLRGRLAMRLAALDPRHAHFICIVARARPFEVLPVGQSRRAE